MKKLSTFAFVIFTLYLSGCAYFNTFYNAKQYFNQAEEEYRSRGKVTSASNALYRKVIEKSSKIIELYPESKYVDDAIYLMGVSYFRMQEYKRAERKFQELLTYFPESPYAKEAHLWLARIYIHSGDYDLARKELRGINSEEAQLLTIRSFVEEGRYKDAVREGEAFLKHHRRSKHAAEVYSYLAEAYARLGNYQLAREYLKLYGEKANLDEAGVQELRYRLGQLYYQSGDYDSAITVLQECEFNQRDTLKPRVELLLGMCYEAKGDTAKAVSVYNYVVDSLSMPSPARIEASYRLARIYEAQDSSELALKQYQRTSRLRGASPYRDEANRRYHALMTVTNMAKDTSSTDTSSTRMFKLAETYLFDLRKPAEAESIYSKLAVSRAGTAMGAKALYALVYLRLNFLHDTVGAAEAFAKLSTWYPSSVYAEEAASFFGDAVKSIADTMSVPPMPIPEPQMVQTDSTSPDSATSIDSSATADTLQKHIGEKAGATIPDSTALTQPAGTQKAAKTLPQIADTTGQKQNTARTSPQSADTTGQKQDTTKMPPQSADTTGSKPAQPPKKTDSN